MIDPETNQNRIDDDMKSDRFENDLKQALRREAAPDGFADRVLARVAQPSSIAEKPRSSWLNFFRFHQPVMRWAAACILCAVLMVTGLEYRQARLERAQGEAAKEQLILALRIAGSKLQLAKSKINEINADQTENQRVKE